MVDAQFQPVQLEALCRSNAFVEDLAFLVRTLKDAYGKVLYTQKAHEKDADRLEGWQSIISVGGIVLLVLNTCAALYVVLGETHPFAVVSALLAAIALFLELLSRSFNLSENILKHRQAATSLWVYREKYAALVCDLEAAAVSATQARQMRDELSNCVAEIYSSSIATTPYGYHKARKAIKSDGEQSFSATELEKLIPGARQ